MRLVTDEEVVQRELAAEQLPGAGGGGGEGAADNVEDEPRFRWKHPFNASTVVSRPPWRQACRIGNATKETQSWIWCDENGSPECLSFDEPQLLQVVGGDEDAPLPGEFVCFFDAKRNETSPLIEVENDVGGLSILCKKTRVRPRVGDVDKIDDVAANPDDAVGTSGTGTGAVLGGTRVVAVVETPDQTRIDVRTSSTVEVSNPMSLVKRAARQKRRKDGGTPGVEMTTLEGDGGGCGSGGGGGGEGASPQV